VSPVKTTTLLPSLIRKAMLSGLWLLPDVLIVSEPESPLAGGQRFEDEMVSSGESQL